VAKGSREIYRQYKSTSDSPVDYTTFKNIIVKFNTSIVDSLLKGGTFNMGNKLSTLSIWRRKRDPRTTRVNWRESLAYKKELDTKGISLYNKETGEGEKWLIYFTDSQYFRFRWHKDKCMVKNKTVYRFDPTRGKKGNKEKLTKLIKEDDLAYLRFKEYKNGNL
tara:strand:+ start:35 stop:526 length:492 start_codon:yes stop_codon:yes gene_type:complete